MADPNESQLIQDALNVLGKDTAISLTGSQSLPGAAAAGAIPAPSTAAAGQASGGGGQGISLSGGQATAPGGGIDILALLRSGKTLAEIGKELFGGPGDLGSRGESGGTSLSDQLRSAQGGGTTVGSGTVPAGATQLGIEPGFGPGSEEILRDLMQNAPFGAGTGGGGVVAGEGVGLLDNSLSLLENLGGWGGAGMTTAALLPIIEQFFGQDIGLPFGGGGRGPAQLAETKGIRGDFSRAFPALAGAGSTFNRFGGLAGLPRDQQIAALQGIAQEGGQQLGAIPGVSNFTSTQGGRQSGGNGSITINPVDVRGVEAVTPTLTMDAFLNSLIANDMLGQLGVPFPSDTTGTTYRNPLGELGPGGVLYQLAQEAGVNPNQFMPQATTDPFATEMGGAPAAFQPTAEQLTGFNTPGQLIPTLQAIFGGLNPEFGASPLGQRLAGLEGFSPGPATAPFTPLPGATPGPATAPATPQGPAVTPATPLGVAPVLASSAQEGVNALGAGPGGTSDEEELRKMLGAA